MYVVEVKSGSKGSVLEYAREMPTTFIHGELSHQVLAWLANVFP